MWRVISAVLLAACSLDQSGLHDDASVSPGGAGNVGGATGASSSTGAMGGSSGGSAMGGAGATGGGDTGGDGGGGGAMTRAPTTCKAILDAGPASDGVHEVDVDGPGPMAPFDVVCDMTSGPGGWTLVGQELAGVGETMAFLGLETGDPSILAGGGSAFIGPRFAGLYDELRIEWDNSRRIRLTPSEEVFANVASLAIPVSGLMTNQDELQTWVSAAGGAVLCRAAATPSSLPGDTSWAIKPANDTNTSCGCNSGFWAGQGAFYSGVTSCDTSTGCICFGPGSFMGVQDDGEPKAGLTGYTTRLWIR